MASGSSRANLLSNENVKLKDEIKQLNESISDVKGKLNSYKDAMVEVICNKYNLPVESVKSKLKAGFSKSDVYSVCESMVRVNSTPIIVSEGNGTISNTQGIKKEINTSVKDLFSMMGNRRGI